MSSVMSSRGRFNADPIACLQERFTAKVYPLILRQSPKVLWFLRNQREKFREAVQEACAYAWKSMLDRPTRRAYASQIARYALQNSAEGRQFARTGIGYTPSRQALESVTRKGRKSPNRPTVIPLLGANHGDDAPVDPPAHAHWQPASIAQAKLDFIAWFAALHPGYQRMVADMIRDPASDLNTFRRRFGMSRGYACKVRAAIRESYSAVVSSGHVRGNLPIIGQSEAQKR